MLLVALLYKERLLAPQQQRKVGYGREPRGSEPKPLRECCIYSCAQLWTTHEEECNLLILVLLCTLKYCYLAADPSFNARLQMGLQMLVPLISKW